MKLTIGDDVNIPATLTRDNATFVIPPGATVTATLVAGASIATTCADTDPGANWAASLVSVIFTSAETATLSKTLKGRLSVRVDDSGKTSWHQYGIEVEDFPS